MSDQEHILLAIGWAFLTLNSINSFQCSVTRGSGVPDAGSHKLRLWSHAVSSCCRRSMKSGFNDPINFFGGTDGHKFVNGVLDKLAAQVREEEVSRRPQ